MDEALLNQLIEIVGLETENLPLFAYSSEIGLYDPLTVSWVKPNDFCSEFYVGDEYFSMICNKALTEFLIKRITKDEYDRLTLIARALDNNN